MKRASLVLIAATVAFMTGCTINIHSSRSFNHRATQQVTVSSQLSAGSKVQTNLTHMDITVTGQETEGCTVFADLSVSATSQEIADAVAEQIDIKLIQEADRLVILLQKPEEYEDDYYVSGRMTITLPLQTSLAIATTHGDCSVENIKGTINIQSSHGDFAFRHIQGDITAISTHGDIELVKSESKTLDFNTTHGRIELNDCDAERIICSTSHDPIRLNTVEADSLNLRTSHDPIELIACTVNQADLHTSHGAIRGDVAAIKRLNARTTHAPIRLQCVNNENPNIIAMLNTTHNNIKFKPPTGFAGGVSASTSHGHIHSDLPITVQGSISEDNIAGTIGQGTGSITMTSSHGDINLKSQQ